MGLKGAFLLACASFGVYGNNLDNVNLGFETELPNELGTVDLSFDIDGDKDFRDAAIYNKEYPYDDRDYFYDGEYSTDELRKPTSRDSSRVRSSCSRLCNRDESNQGVCMRAGECFARNGEKRGICPKRDLLGEDMVCCRFDKTCDSRRENSELVSYFSSPNFPARMRDELSCTHVVKVRPRVCQLRFDFIEFELPAPDQFGKCRNSDNLEIFSPLHALGVLGRGTSDFCGLNADQHLYIEARPGDLVTLTATLSGTSAVPLATTSGSLDSDTAYKWRLKITQVECGCDQAPDGCLQYFREMRGDIKSFNFDGKAIFRPSQSYGICVRQVRHSCSITLRSINFALPFGSKCCEDGSKVSGLVDSNSYLSCPGTQPPGPYDTNSLATGHPHRPRPQYPPGNNFHEHEIRKRNAVGSNFDDLFVACCTQMPNYAFLGINGDTDGFGVQKRFRFCGFDLGKTGTVVSVMRPFRIQVESGEFNTKDFPNDRFVGFNVKFEVNTGSC